MPDIGFSCIHVTNIIHMLRDIYLSGRSGMYLSAKLNDSNVNNYLGQKKDNKCNNIVSAVKQALAGF